MNYLAVLVSGSGTNLQALIDATESGALGDTRISVVVSNRRDAYALARAAQHGIPTLYHPLRPYLRSQGAQSRETYDAALADRMSAFPVDLVVLAGWMHILSMSFLGRYRGRVLNIHPALPGCFPGTHAIERAYKASQKGHINHTGVMVHYVPDEGVDDGPVIIQREVPIPPADTIEDLEARIHAVEHEIYVQAVGLALQRLGADGDRGALAPDQSRA